MSDPGGNDGSDEEGASSPPSTAAVAASRLILSRVLRARAGGPSHWSIKMPGRKTFFSFHYERDVWRTAIVRNANIVDAQAAGGWEDASIWESAKRTGKAAVHRLIDNALHGTSVTVILIGRDTHRRAYV